MWLSALFTGWVALCILGYFFLSWVRRLVRITDITKKYIFITGCDSGFGHLLAQRLDLMGCNVFAACLTDAGQHKLKTVTSSRLHALLCDVTRDDHVKQALDYVKSNLPPDEGLWGLVNNAGVLGSVLGPIEWTTVEDFQRTFDINLLGQVRTILAFLPLLKKAQGRIVNMSSVSGRISGSLSLPYCVSKFGVEALSDGLRVHLAHFGVSVHILEPGGFRSEIMTSERIKAMVERGWHNCSMLTKEEFGQQYYEKLKQIGDIIPERSSPSLHNVVNAYVHALTARFPRTRYTVGWDARLFYLPMSYMPSVIQDMALSRFLKQLCPANAKPSE